MVLAVNEFRELLESTARRFPSKQAFAKAIGVTPSRFSRVLAGQHSLNVLNCLRLAKLAGVPPSTVLHAAKKHEIAALLEELYGPEPVGLIAEEIEMLETWRRLTPEARDGLRAVLAGMASSKPKARTMSRPPPSKPSRDAAHERARRGAPK